MAIDVLLLVSISVDLYDQINVFNCLNESCGYLYKQTVYMLSGYVKWHNHTNALSMYRLPHEHNTHVNLTYT